MSRMCIITCVYPPYLKLLYGIITQHDTKERGVGRDKGGAKFKITVHTTIVIAIIRFKEILTFIYDLCLTLDMCVHVYCTYFHYY